MTIHIYTNLVAGGWHPKDLKNGLGGSEEAVVELAQAIAKKGKRVKVYIPKFKNFILLNNVEYQSEIDLELNLEAKDILIEFKTTYDNILNIKPKKYIHWCCEVERPYDASKIDYFINPTDYCKTRHFWVPQEKNLSIPFGVDFDSLDANKKEKKKNTMLYSSSPDRGLVQLLNDWPKIRQHNPKMILTVAYGFDRMIAIAGERAKHFINHCMQLMNQEGVNYVGHQNKKQIEELYWKNQYWVLPLNNPDSELFCLNAVKAQYCKSIPIVNKIGALKNTVGNYIPYEHFIAGGLEITEEESIKFRTWEAVANQFIELMK